MSDRNAVFQCIHHITLHHPFCLSNRWAMERSNEGQFLAAWAYVLSRFQIVFGVNPDLDSFEIMEW